MSLNVVKKKREETLGRWGKARDMPEMDVESLWSREGTSVSELMVREDLTKFLDRNWERVGRDKNITSLRLSQDFIGELNRKGMRLRASDADQVATYFSMYISEARTRKGDKRGVMDRLLADLPRIYMTMARIAAERG